ncbi:MFS transporter [Geodermatophilus sabuli]|uniref:MFS transporter, DHA1 family, inner membrane transport protein n=1 Tax=Geodermatophilus sabuli TaxID=1564158 RepID=A0A285E7Z8_9ACTN|nr:MFS transporter [Geodermatophilus sabuli]MBB3082800.1 DHA1 family inner membrane transport protein [Geodermatophilus sabuli]SNX94334.1 MFS transporter, DHA1 family, inner membrane transport protein [Geodermatophilus sabuli]
MPRGLLALAIGAFGIGTTEFVVMGMLPQIADGLGVSVSAVGMLISAYAIGVVIGAPTLTAFGVRFSPRQTLVGLMVVFVVGNALSALAPTYETLVAARVLTALAHGSFFGVGAVAARRLVSPDRATQAISLMMVGLTLANVIGVPVGTFVAQQTSWRLVLGGIAVIGLVTIGCLLAWLPKHAGEPGDLRAELRAFRRGEVWLVLGLTMVGFAALFSVYSYVSPILTELGGIPEAWVTPVLALFGVGMTLGTLLGGRYGDRYGFSFVAVGLLGTAVVLAAFAFLARTPVAAVALLVLFGVIAFSLGPVVQNGVIEAARVRGGSLVSAANQGAFNVANALGAALGALVLSAGFDYTAPMWVGVVLAVLGAGIAVFARSVGRRAAVPVTAAQPTPEVVGSTA